MSHDRGRADPSPQLDLFADGPFQDPPRDAASARQTLAPRPAELDNASLVAAIPDTSLRTCRALCEEAARRQLESAVPALEALCRRFAGFGAAHVIPEQEAALAGLRVIGGPDAARAVARLIVGKIVIGPGMIGAAEAACALGARLPAATALILLRHPEPLVRAAACRLAGAGTEETAVLADLLDDLHPPVAAAAACALGRRGRTEVRGVLLDLLRAAPSAEAIEAAAGVADETILVTLGRVARARADLAGAVLAALEGLDDPLAAVIAESIRKRSGGGRTGP